MVHVWLMFLIVALTVHIANNNDVFQSFTVATTQVTSGKPMEFCATSGGGEIITNSSSTVEYLHKTTVYWVKFCCKTQFYRDQNFARLYNL